MTATSESCSRTSLRRTWLPFAKTLADKGYRALAFDFRGSGASAAQFGAKATRSHLDVVAAASELRRLGARAAGSVDKRLVVFPEDWHGWDLLYHAPYKAQVNALVFDFLREHSQ